LESWVLDWLELFGVFSSLIECRSLSIALSKNFALSVPDIRSILISNVASVPNHLLKELLLLFLLQQSLSLYRVSYSEFAPNSRLLGGSFTLSLGWFSLQSVFT